MTSPCSLCGSNDVQVVRTVRTSDIKKIYSFIGIDVGAEFGAVEEIGLAECACCGLQFFLPCLSGSPFYYKQLQQKPWYYPSEKSEFSFARRYITTTDSVLEIGCGKGAFADHIECREYVGLEYTETSVLMARANGLNVLGESINSYASRLAQPHDVVCFFQVLEHIPQVGVFLEASLSCLRPGGLLILSVPSADSFLNLSLNNILNLPPHHVTRWTQRTLFSLADRFKLSIVSHQHEMLADEHIQNYLETVILLASSKAYRESMPLTDLSLSYRLRARLVSKLAKMVAPVMLSQKYLRPLGHSITFVYRKGTS